jgi:hypothetical protein
MKKFCIGCQKIKQAKDFNKHYQTRDGLRTRCKKCTYIQNREWIAKNIDQHRKYAAEYQRNLPTEKKTASAKEWREKNRDRFNEMHRCHAKVYLAIRSGKLKKKPCEKCGIKEKVHAHHDDYTKPLEVRWLCPLHHKQTQLSRI